MKKYDLIFITTFINKDVVKVLLESSLKNKSVSLCMVLVGQKGLKMDLEPYRTPWTDFHQIVIPGLLNSSQGRNVGIDYVLQQGIISDFVMFPDDDSSFDKEFFDGFNGNAKRGYCYLTDVKDPKGSGKYFVKINKKAFATSSPKTGYLKRNLWNCVGAVNMLLDYNTFLNVGRFDERMGVGAEYGAGEDSDYFLRSLDGGAIYLYDPDLYSCHPLGKDRYKTLSYSQLLNRFKKYGEGVVYMLCKHKMYGQAFKICFKGLGGCAVSLLKLDFKMSFVYLYAFWQRSKMLCKLITNR